MTGFKAGQVSSDSTDRDEPCPHTPGTLETGGRPGSERQWQDRVRFSIDGVVGELADALKFLGQPVLRISLDEFNNVSAARYRRGRLSPEGVLARFVQLSAVARRRAGAAGTPHYRSSTHDLTSDLVLTRASKVAPCRLFPRSRKAVDGPDA